MENSGETVLKPSKIKKTMNNPLQIVGLLREKEQKIIKAKSITTLKTIYKKELSSIMDSNGPRKRKPNHEGFFESTINNVKNGYSISTFESLNKWDLSDREYRVEVGYGDVTDKETIEWWLIY